VEDLVGEVDKGLAGRGGGEGDAGFGEIVDEDVGVSKLFFGEGAVDGWVIEGGFEGLEEREQARPAEVELDQHGSWLSCRSRVRKATYTSSLGYRLTS
jgi:hypothetical protein